jgi:O-antigen ligase
LALVYHFAIWPPVIALCWIVALCLATAQPRVGLGLALLLLPFFYQHKEVVLVNRTISMPPAYVLLAGLLPTLCLRLWQRIRQRTLRFDALDWLAGTWLLVSFVAAANVWHWPGYGRGMLDLVLAPLIVYLAIRGLTDQSTAWRSAAGGLAAGGVLVALIGLGGWLLGMGTATDSVLRLVGPHFSPNHTALYLERTLFLLAGFVWASRGNWRWISLAALGCTLLALLLTASRGAWLLGVPVGAACFVLLGGPQSGRNESATSARPSVVWLAVAALAFMAMMAVGVAGFGWERLSNQATVLDRLAIWRSTTALWHDFPLAGVGPGGFYWRYPAYLPLGSTMDPNLRHPHNLWLEYGSMWGAIGLGWIVFVLGVLWCSLRRRWRNWPTAPQQWTACRPIAAGLVAGLAAGVAHGQVDAFGALADLAAWNWAALGLLSVVVIQVRGETDE